MENGTDNETQVVHTEISGFELENRVIHYDKMTKQLFAHLESAIRLSTGQSDVDKFTEQTMPAYKKMIDQYFIYMQKHSKWNEFYNTFCVTQAVNVLGKQTTLLDAIQAREGFANLLSVWEASSYKITDVGLSTRITREPTIDNVLIQQQNLIEIVFEYDKEIAVAKARSVVVNIPKQLYVL